MCLISHSPPKISDKPIKVYKIVERKWDGLHAPFQKYYKYVKFPIIESNSTCPPFQNREQYQYGYGFIHAFTTEESVKHEIKLLHSCPGSRMFEIYEGYIPENTEYSYSQSGYEICARKIILEKMI